jgi:hypothetical protein
VAGDPLQEFSSQRHSVQDMERCTVFSAQASAAGAQDDECKALDLAMLLSSAARLRLRPPGLWVTEILEAALPEMHAFPPQVGR